MRVVISKVGLVDFKSCWSVIRENGILKLLEWNNALLKVISKVGLVDLMAVRMRDEGEWDNPKVKPAVVKEKPDDVTSKVSKGKKLDVLKYKRKIEKESNAFDGIHHEDDDGDDDDDGGNTNDNWDNETDVDSDDSNGDSNNNNGDADDNDEDGQDSIENKASNKKDNEN
nr:hypothetical protein [Tanacetum cinerariifolium]